MITKLFSSFFILCFSSYLFSQFTWKDMSTVYPAGINNLNLRFSIVDDHVIWANYWDASGKVAFTKSTNSGNTWSAVNNTLQYDPYYFKVEDFQAISENVAYLATRFYGANSGKGKLSKTLDGGNSWIEMKNFVTIIDQIFFWDANTGIVICHPNMNPGGSKKIEIFRTTDGGNTWEAKGGALLTNSKPNQIARVIYDSYNNSYWFGSSDGEMIKTNDKGSTWSVTQTLYDSSAYFNGPKSLGYFILTDSNTAFYTDFNTGKFYKTTDGFVTEQYISDPGLGFGTQIEKIPNTNIIIAVGGMNGSLSIKKSKYSIDEGLSWVTIENMGRFGVQSEGINMTFAFGSEGNGTEFTNDYWGIVKLNGGLPPNTGPVIGPGVVIPPSTNPPDDVVFDIYPIPTGDYLYFKSKYENLDFTMWDSAGRLILKGNTLAKKVDVSSFPEGTYHINVIYEGQEIIRKFIKK